MNTVSTSIINQDFIGKCFPLTVNQQHQTFLKNAIELEMGNLQESCYRVQDAFCVSWKTRGMNYGFLCEQLNFLHNDKLANQFVLADSWTIISCGS